MNWTWTSCIFVLVFCVVVGELASGFCAERKRRILGQPIPIAAKLRLRFLRMAIITVLVLLAGICGSIDPLCYFGNPKEGIAVVFDVPNYDEESVISMQKQAVESLLENSDDVPVSLYEWRGGALVSSCPPTVDRVFFRLQLGGVEPSGFFDGAIVQASKIEQRVFQDQSGVRPWVVIVTPHGAPVDVGGLDAVAVITVQGNTMLPSVYYRGMRREFGSIAILANHILSQIAMLQRDPVLSEEAMVLMRSIVFLAFVLFLIWRARWPVLGVLTFMAFSVEGTGYAMEGNGSNALVREAIELVRSGDFIASQNRLLSALNSTTDPEARVRLLYDCAVVSYIKEDNAASLNWIAAIQREPGYLMVRRETETLKGLIFIRLVREFSSPQVFQERKKQLQLWLGEAPEVAPELIDMAQLALRTSRLQQEESIRFTIHWLQNALFAIQDSGRETLFRCAEGITTVTNGMVEKYLERFFGKDVTKKFLLDTVRIDSMLALNRIYIWYFISGAHTIQESIDYLFQAASTLSNRVLYFPFFAPIYAHNIILVEDLLRNLQVKLPPPQRKAFFCLMNNTVTSIEEQAAFWYALRIVWPTILFEGVERYKAILVTLNDEMQKSLPISTGRILATAATCVLPLHEEVSGSDHPLEDVIMAICHAWYRQDAVDLFQFLLAQPGHRERVWTQRIQHLVLESMHQDSHCSQMALAISQVVETSGITHFDPELLGRLWLIGLVQKNVTKTLRDRVQQVLNLLKTLHTSLVQPNDEVLNTLCLIYQAMPDIETLLRRTSTWVPKKHEDEYLSLLKEYVQRSEGVEHQILEPSTFRLLKVRDEILASTIVLRQMLSLCSEIVPRESVLAIGTPQATEGSATIRRESAVMLFQELDRADRTLLGE